MRDGTKASVRLAKPHDSYIFDPRIVADRGSNIREIRLIDRSVIRNTALVPPSRTIAVYYLAHQ